MSKVARFPLLALRTIRPRGSGRRLAGGASDRKSNSSVSSADGALDISCRRCLCVTPPPALGLIFFAEATLKGLSLRFAI